MTRARLCLSFITLVGCADPCADLPSPPSLEIGGASDDGVTFESFSPGASRNLVTGFQGGMHVWLHARITGLCPTTATLDRRVVDDASGDLYQLGRGPVDFVEVEPGTFALTEALPMALCPPIMDRPVVDQPLRFLVVAEDGEGRRADAELPFVPRCPDGTDCTIFCGP